jgi:uncharacterized membrane protein YeiH
MKKEMPFVFNKEVYADMSFVSGFLKEEEEY